jgi:Flp pilus assembly protein TadG
MRNRTANQKPTGRATRWGSGVLRDTSGSAVLYSALIMPVLIGSVGLAADVGVWYAAKRTAQAAADAAAIAATYEVVRERSGSVIVAAAEQDAGANGYNPDAGDVLTVNNPPTSGPFAGDDTAVEVLFQRTPPAFFSRLFSSCRRSARIAAP